MRLERFKYDLIFCSWMCLASTLVFAQEKSDSLLYQNIEKRANKHRITKFIYDVVFENLENDPKDGPAVSIAKKTTNPFMKYKGNTIRTIQVVVLEPFGYSVNNFYGKRPDYLESKGNKFHMTTKEKIIRNLLMFKQEETLDPLSISESERLLRLSPYIFDARIYVQKYKGKPGDSVDVLVVVQDKWSTTAVSQFDINAPNLNVFEKNFMGFGHQLDENIIWNNTDKYLATQGNYTVANFKKTYITGTAFYSATKDNKQLGIRLHRPFYSPLTKYAGGIELVKTNTFLFQASTEPEIIDKYPLNYHASDVWLAKSYPLAQSKSASIENRSSNFVTGARYYRINFTDRPSFVIDNNYINTDQSLYLTNFGFTKRKYYRDRYLFRYGANEDIPEGQSIELVLGAMKKELNPLSYYAGFKFGTGKHFDNIGYLSGGFGYGTFINQYIAETGVFNVEAFYFSDLIKIKKWYYRQFIRYNLVEGINRAVYENVNINGAQMNGYSNDYIVANSKMILNFQFLAYAPYKLIGFQFAPVVLCGFAGLGNNTSSLFTNSWYQSYAIGVLIRNEYLVSSTFQVSIGLYPFMSSSQPLAMKLNPISNYEVKARDYFISKPDLVPYQ